MSVYEQATKYLRRFWPPFTVPEPIRRRREKSRLPLRRRLSVEKAFRHRMSRVWLTMAGTVTAILPDDTHGNRHQRFIVTTSSVLRVQVAHSLDMAPRVPLMLGDHIVVCGQYLWTKKGGTIHWTHDGPEATCDMGYIYHPQSGQRYE